MSGTAEPEDPATLQDKLTILREKKERLVERLGVVGEHTQESVESLESNVNNALRSVQQDISTIASSFKLFAWSIRILWSLFCGVLFVGLFISGLPSLPAALPIILLFALGTVINEHFISARRNLVQRYVEKVASESRMRKSQESRPQNSSTPTGFSIIKSIAASVGSGLKQVTVTISGLIPTINDWMQIEDLFAKQSRLAGNFQYALRRYRFKNDPTLELMLESFSSFAKNEDIWANTLFKAVSKNTNVDEKIIRLIFYDSLNQVSNTGIAWLSAKTDSELLEALAKLLITNELVQSPQGVPGATKTLSKLLSDLPDYSLDLARLKADAFFVELAGFKSECINHLRGYGLAFNQREHEVIEFMPPALSLTGTWKKDVLATAAEILGLDATYVVLLVSEGVGDYATSASIWRTIVETGKVAGLAKILIRNGIVKITAGMEEEPTIRRLAVVMGGINDKFSFKDAVSGLSKLEAEILRHRRSILLCAKVYSIDLDSFFGLDFVPQNTHSVEKELIDEAIKTLRVNPLIFRMLYATTINSTDADELYQTIKTDGQLGQLSDFLQFRHLLPSVPFSEHLPTLLGFFQTFDLQEVNSAFAYYEKLVALSQNLLVFVEENGLGKPDPRLSFEEIARICPVRRKVGYEEGIVRILTELITFELKSGRLSQAQELELASAAAALFLHVQSDQAASRLCREVGYMKFGSQVLYEYAKLSDESGLTQKPPTLYSATEAALSHADNDRYYSSFVDELHAGILHVRVTYLLSKQVGEIRDFLEKIEKKGFESEKIAESLKEAIRDVLEKEIDNDTVGDLLLRQVLSAYIITVPGIRPVMSLLDVYLEGAAKLVAEEKRDPKFSEFIMLRKGSGSWTRVGLVPYGMSFEEFAIGFEVIAKKAIEMYKTANPNHQDPLTHYLIRILPSSDALKVVAEDPQRKESPLTIVRMLISERMPRVDGLQVLSVAQSSGTSTVKLRMVISSVLDSSKSSLQALLGDSLNPIIKESGWLGNIFENKEIEKILFVEYGASGLSGLAIAVTKLALADEESALELFQKQIERAFPKGRSIESEKSKLLSKLLFQSLRNIGLVLTV